MIRHRLRFRFDGAWLGGVLAVAAAGCNEQINMVQQPITDTYESSPLFADGAAARPFVEGVVSTDGIVFTSRPEATAPPRPPMTAELVSRGRELFHISCRPCHGEAGYGDGMVVQRGYPKPPSYHTDRLRSKSDDYILRVITSGLGKMPSYYDQVPEGRDRWALVAYVRALQLSQHALLDDVPPSVQAELTRNATADAANANGRSHGRRDE